LEAKHRKKQKAKWRRICFYFHQKNSSSKKSKACNSPKCSLKCASKISESDRQTINSGFWGLTTARKSDYYSKYVVRSETKRTRTDTVKTRLHTYKYYLEIRGATYQVCKSFFLNTLNISSHTIYYFYEKFMDKTTTC
jgi:hypothetical protein